MGRVGDDVTEDGDAKTGRKSRLDGAAPRSTTGNGDRPARPVAARTRKRVAAGPSVAAPGDSEVVDAPDPDEISDPRPRRVTRSATRRPAADVTPTWAEAVVEVPAELLLPMLGEVEQLDPQATGTEGATGSSPRTIQDVWSALTMPSVWAVLIAVLLGGLAAFGGAEYERTRVPIYQSQAVLLLDNPVGITADPAFFLGVSQARAKYAGLANTDLIAGPAAARLGVSESGLAASVRAVFDAQSLDIFVVARALDPAKAPVFANAIANQLIYYVTVEQATLPPSVSPSLRLKMTIVSSAGTGILVSPTHRKEETTGIVAGTIVFVSTYVIAQLMIDARRRRRVRRARRATAAPA